MNDFKRGWPESFYQTLGKLATTMDQNKKHVSVGNTKVYDQDLIYARVIGLISSSREIDFKEVLAYELTAIGVQFRWRNENRQIKIGPETKKYKSHYPSVIAFVRIPSYMMSLHFFGQFHGHLASSEDS